jgi:hypothetical protein
VSAESSSTTVAFKGCSLVENDCANIRPVFCIRCCRLNVASALTSDNLCSTFLAVPAVNLLEMKFERGRRIMILPGAKERVLGISVKRRARNNHGKVCFSGEEK